MYEVTLRLINAFPLGFTLLCTRTVLGMQTAIKFKRRSLQRNQRPPFDNTHIVHRCSSPQQRRMLIVR